MFLIRNSFFVFTLVLILSSYSHSEVVKKVEVVGNERVSLETIMIFGDIKKGENYEQDDVNQIIKKLYDTTFFADIKTLHFITSGI